MKLSLDSQDWKLIISNPYPTIPANRIINLGWQFKSYYLMVQVSTSNQRDTWQNAGTLWATSFVNGYNTRFFTRDLDLYAQELIIIPNLFPQKFSLSYRPPKYFTNVTLKIWNYVGVIEEDILLTQNQQILSMLEEILSKLTSDNSEEINTGLAFFTGMI